MKYLMLLLSLCAGLAHAACTTTLSAGANVGSAISSAAAGSTICLNDGSYGAVTLSSVVKNPAVTVQAVNQKQASLTGQLTMSGSTAGIIFDGVNMPTVAISGAVRDVTVKNFTTTGQVHIGPSTIASNVNPNIVIDNLTQTNLNVSNADPAGVYVDNYPTARSAVLATLRHLHIDGGCADGVRSDVPFILEYSDIKNKQVGNCPNDPHVDAVQFYGLGYTGSIVRGNYFYCNIQVLAAYDGVSGVLVENNVLDPGPSGCGGAGEIGRRDCQIEFFSDDGSTIQHNTIVNRGSSYGKICFGNKAVDDAGKNTILRNNSAASIDLNAQTGGQAATLAINTNNLLASGASGSNIAGSPTFTGGTYPTTLPGFKLTIGSAGHNAATDGQDVGTLYYGATGAAPNDPTNIVVTQLIGEY